MHKPELTALKEEVKEFVKSLESNPDDRLSSRRLFYEKYGGGADSNEYGYGESEIDFMKWEIDRVIHPKNKHLSEWWNAINLWFIYLSELGAKAVDAGMPKDNLPIASQFWVNYIQEPSSKNWYRAHNSSIIDAYLKYQNLAKKEDISEQTFLNIVLYRLLYAQAMVEGENYAFGRFGNLFANPKGFAVKIVTRFENFYPLNYPMTEHEVKVLLGKTNNLSALGMKVLDDVIIEPVFQQLYQDASEWNKQPELMSFLVENIPAYPDGKPKFEGKKKMVIGWLLKARRFLRL